MMSLISGFQFGEDGIKRKGGNFFCFLFSFHETRSNAAQPEHFGGDHGATNYYTTIYP